MTRAPDGVLLQIEPSSWGSPPRPRGGRAGEACSLFLREDSGLLDGEFFGQRVSGDLDGLQHLLDLFWENPIEVKQLEDVVNVRPCKQLVLANLLLPGLDGCQHLAGCDRLATGVEHLFRDLTPFGLDLTFRISVCPVPRNEAPGLAMRVLVADNRESSTVTFLDE